MRGLRSFLNVTREGGTEKTELTGQDRKTWADA